MHTQGIFDFESVNLFSIFGWSHSFLLINLKTVFATWIAMGIIIVFSLICRYYLSYSTGYLRYSVISSIKAFRDLFVQAIGKFEYLHFSYLLALFVFILICNTISIIPWVDEPTSDINTPLALGILSFIYTQVSSIYSHGALEYMKEYFRPFPFMFPLHLIGNISNVVSISFRLFGNIFGGAIIVKLYTQFISHTFLYEMLGILSGSNILVTIFFSVFEGAIQAFVFTMLAMTYLSLAIGHEEEMPS